MREVAELSGATELHVQKIRRGVGHCQRARKKLRVFLTPAMGWLTVGPKLLEDLGAEVLRLM